MPPITCQKTNWRKRTAWAEAAKQANIPFIMSGTSTGSIEELGKKLEPEFWAASLKADTDSVARLKEGGMEVANIPPAMMKDFRAKTEPLLGEFLKKSLHEAHGDLQDMRDLFRT